MEKEGTTGIGHTGTTKYGAEGAKVIPNGGNEAIHDHVVTKGGKGDGSNKGDAKQGTSGM